MDNEEKMRLRNRRSQKDLISALISLGKDKSIYRISVKELCDTAEVNRTTFYKHYYSIDNFIEHLIADFIYDMTVALGEKNPYSKLLETDHPEIIFSGMVHYMNCDKNARFIKLMLSENGSPLFRKSVKTAMRVQIEEALQEHKHLLNKNISIESLASCVSSMIVEHISYHLNLSTPQSYDAIAREISLLLYEGVLSSFGLVSRT